MKFIKLNTPEGTKVMINIEKISRIEKFDQTRYIYFGADDYVIVKETLQEIEGMINAPS